MGPRTTFARAATNLGHEAWMMGVGDFAYDPDGSIHARARAVPEPAGDAFPLDPAPAAPRTEPAQTAQDPLAAAPHEAHRLRGILDHPPQ